MIKMIYEKTTKSMNDRELLIRIDERLENIDKLVQVQDIEIDDLKMWKNRMAGGLSIVLGLTGYSFLF